ncbi:MAG: hypothetical protein EOO07_10525 [Chitinophagaceae bacterium]|nr:MAG: hypothetical protein EOO07_10525 [Chitinophagaceae bacterium]
METIAAVQKKGFWDAATLPNIENIRIELRDLLKFLDVENAPVYYTSFEDEIDGQVKEHQVIYNFNDLNAYRKKVEFYLKEKRNHITIHKLVNNIPITNGELVELEKLLFEQGAIGTKEEFTKAYGEKSLGQFIRGILGLDINAAKLAFGEILSQQTLNSQQIRFMDTLINFFSVKDLKTYNLSQFYANKTNIDLYFYFFGGAVRIYTPITNRAGEAWSSDPANNVPLLETWTGRNNTKIKKYVPGSYSFNFDDVTSTDLKTPAIQNYLNTASTATDFAGLVAGESIFFQTSASSTAPSKIGMMKIESFTVDPTNNTKGFYIVSFKVIQ